MAWEGDKFLANPRIPTDPLPSVRTPEPSPSFHRPGSEEVPWILGVGGPERRFRDPDTNGRGSWVVPTGTPLGRSQRREHVWTVHLRDLGRDTVFDTSESRWEFPRVVRIPSGGDRPCLDGGSRVVSL